MYTDSFYVRDFLQYLMLMAAILVSTWGNIDYINRLDGQYEKFIYESREWIYLKKMYRFFPCYDKQKPQFILKKVFVLQSIWYGFILLILIFGVTAFFLDERIVYEIVFFPCVGFACHAAALRDKAIKTANIRFKLNETNEK